MSKPHTPIAHGCTLCGAPPADSIYVAKAPYLFCKDCTPKETGDPTLDGMVHAALCSVDPAVIRAATDKFAARHNIPTSRLSLPSLEHGTSAIYPAKQQPAIV